MAGLQTEVVHLENPRVESEAHYYKAANSALLDLGLEPHLLSDETIERLLGMAVAGRDRVKLETTAPAIDWRTGGPPSIPAAGDVASTTV
jgi:UDP-sulfoquinovose synthase